MVFRRKPASVGGGGGGDARRARAAAGAAATLRRKCRAAVRLQAAWRCYECRTKYLMYVQPPFVPDEYLAAWHAVWRRLRDIWGQLSYDELGEYLREVQADLYARLKEKEEEAERLRLLAATTKWIEAMPSVHYSPLTAALRRQGEIGEHLPRRARMLRARRAAHSCAPPQHRAAKPPIIHYRPVPVC